MFFRPSPVEAQPLPATAMPFLNRCYLYSTREHSDPTFVWGSEVDVTNLQNFLKDSNHGRCSTLLTTSAILIRLTGLALKEHPEFNRRILGNRIHRFRQANIMFPMQRRNLGPALGLIRDVDQLSYKEIAAELWRQQHSIAHGGGSQKWAEGVFGRIPAWLARMLLRGWLWMGNNVEKPMGPFDQALRGAPVLVNHFGFQDAPPMLSYKPSRFASHCLLLNITLGPSSQRPAVVDGQVLARPIAGLFVRADHRTVDAKELSQFVRTLTDLISNPREFDLIPDCSEGQNEAHVASPVLSEA